MEAQPITINLSDSTTQEKNKQKMGKLKIFFGYAAGVGKTYAMLKAAHTAKKAGIDVVAGYIEPHDRPETSQLLDGLEVLPTLPVHWQTMVFQEFDVDAAIKRHPALILVDELAHTNARGSRNLKRYQDIYELLRAGIDVYTTVNVQHIESLHDMVYQITNIAVSERIPDKVFDDADTVELVDIAPEALVERLNQGKVYSNDKVQRALENFFTLKNLVALREISLRRIADQINHKAEPDRQSGQQHAYYTSEHILICLSSSPSNAKVIRTAARMVSAFHGSFTALYVVTPDTETLSDDNKARLQANLHLAEQLGAKIVTVYGENIPEQIAEYAKIANVSKIIIGRSTNRKGGFSKQNFVDKITQLSPNLDVYIIPDNSRTTESKPQAKTFQPPTLVLGDLLKSLGALIAATLLGFIFDHYSFNDANIIMVYILSVLLTAIWTSGKIYSTVTSLVSVLVYNYFFTDPRLTFNAYGADYPVTFVIMFIVAMLTSTLAMRVKKQSRQNALKAQRTETLLETSQKLQKALGKEQIYDVMGEQLLKLLDRPILIYPVQKDSTFGQIHFYTNHPEETMDRFLTIEEHAVAQWVLKNNKHAGATTHTLSGARCLYLAIRGQETIHAVVAIAIIDEPIEAYEKNLFIAMLGEFGLSLENESISEAKQEIHAQAQQEQLRANLLRAISHDLRTPLTSISGNADILMTNDHLLTPDKRVQLYNDIYDDAIWLINLVENLLSVTRIDQSPQIALQPELVEDVIAEALKHINRKRDQYTIHINVPDELLMAQMDARLIIQVLINIIDNAIKYTSPGTTINIHADRVNNDEVIIEISDNGQGLSDEAKSKIFDMFFTADNNIGDSRRGLGLGLALCQSIINAHHGMISVRDNTPTGTIFAFTLKAKEAFSYE